MKKLFYLTQYQIIPGSELPQQPNQGAGEK
jgi:hypothetical protein